MFQNSQQMTVTANRKKTALMFLLQNALWWIDCYKNNSSSLFSHPICTWIHHQSCPWMAVTSHFLMKLQQLNWKSHIFKWSHPAIFLRRGNHSESDKKSSDRNAAEKIHPSSELSFRLSFNSMKPAEFWMKTRSSASNMEFLVGGRELVGTGSILGGGQQEFGSF